MPFKTKHKGCSTTGCDGVHLARGKCVKHYSEEKRREAGVPERGDPKPKKLEFMVPTSLYDRFLEAVPRRQRSDVLRRALEAELSKIQEEGVGS